MSLINHATFYNETALGVPLPRKAITERRARRSFIVLAKSWLAGGLICCAGVELSFANETSAPEMCAHLARSGVIGGCHNAGGGSRGGPAKNPIETTLPQNFPKKVRGSGLPQAQDWSSGGISETYPVRENKPNFVEKREAACQKKKTQAERQRYLDSINPP